MINKDSTLSFDKICRSCMAEGAGMRSVYESNTNSIQLAEMIMACASVQVVSGDGLPALICIKCEEQLNIAYLFKQTCERSDAALREYSNHNISNNIKDGSLDIVVKPDIDMLEMYDDNDDRYSGSESEHSNYSTKLRKKKKSTKSKTRQCRFCQKMLSTKEGLRLHERRHTGEKLKVCPVCDASFAKTYHLIRHMQLHNKPTDEYKHICQECGMAFMKAFHLVKHKKEHKAQAETGATTATTVKSEEPDNSSSAPVVSTTDANIINTLSEFPETSAPEDEKPPTETTITDVAMIDDGDTSVKREEDSEPEEKPKLRSKRESADTDKSHRCKVCNKVLTTAAGLQIHMRRHTGVNLSTCYICMKSFTKTSHLNRHMLTHGITPDKNATKEKSNEPKEKKYMACEFCDRKFVYRKSFLHHIQLEHQISEDSDTPLSEYATIITKPKTENDQNNTENGDLNQSAGSLDNQSMDENAKQQPAQMDDDFAEFLKQEEEKKIHTCHVCNHKFTRANHLTRHMTLHRAVLTHKCDRCEKAFMTEEHLAKHVQEYHVDRPYVCSLCNKPFSRGEHLIRHLKVHDKDSDNKDEHKCSICDKVFNRADHLARHTKLHLAQDKRHVCSECGKAFNRLDNLRTHARIHTGIRDPQRLHLCIYCGKEFNNSSNMIVHMRRHTGERPYKCGQCGKGFPRSHDLKCHERTHSGEKPYLCTLCGKSFNKSNKLLRHTRVHTGERPYVCNLCGRAFTQSNDLALHMRRHTGSRPYACGMCPARFIQSGQLKAHRRSQGHWLETQPDLKGAHRVTPVTPLVNPPPIKFKSRVHKIKEESSTILGHTIGISKADDETDKLLEYQTAPGLAVAAFVHREPVVKQDMKIEEVHNFSVTNLSRDTSMDNTHLEHRPTTSTAYQTAVEPSTSYSNNITITSNTFSVSEGYTYQSYG